MTSEGNYYHKMYICKYHISFPPDYYFSYYFIMCAVSFSIECLYSVI
jgi:hypothetical protein